MGVRFHSVRNLFIDYQEIEMNGRDLDRYKRMLLEKRGEMTVTSAGSNPISRARLKAVPWTRHCRDCKEREHSLRNETNQEVLQIARPSNFMSSRTFQVQPKPSSKFRESFVEVHGERTQRKDHERRLAGSVFTSHCSGTVSLYKG